MEDHSAEVIVRLSAPAAQTVLVDYTTQSGTAVEGSEFLPARGRLAFPPGETEKTVSAFVIGDSKDEAEEYFSIVLANPQNASLGAAQARVMILDGQVGSDPGADTLQGLSVTDTYTAYHDGFEGSMGVDGCRAGGWMRHDQNLNDRLRYRVQVDETVIFTGDANCHPHPHRFSHSHANPDAHAQPYRHGYGYTHPHPAARQRHLPQLLLRRWGAGGHARAGRPG